MVAMLYEKGEGKRVRLMVVPVIMVHSVRSKTSSRGLFLTRKERPKSEISLQPLMFSSFRAVKDCKRKTEVNRVHRDTLSFCSLGRRVARVEPLRSEMFAWLTLYRCVGESVNE